MMNTAVRLGLVIEAVPRAARPSLAQITEDEL
jgi:hypothetical protein